MDSTFLIKFCAPTLAGLKVANLFSLKDYDLKELETQIHSFNTLLNPKGIFLELIQPSSTMALVYVYRREKLISILQDTRIQEFLFPFGYETIEIDNCITLLKKHLTHHDFPHEIGVFLGYPLADVQSFIKYNGLKHKFLGHWKVYSNVNEAKALFQKYDKCTMIYMQKYKQGTALTTLAVAT